MKYSIVTVVTLAALGTFVMSANAQQADDEPLSEAQCMEAFGNSPARSSCYGAYANVVGERKCRISAHCEEDLPYSANFTQKTVPYDRVHTLRNCNGRLC